MLIIAGFWVSESIQFCLIRFGQAVRFGKGTLPSPGTFRRRNASLKISLKNQHAKRSGQPARTGKAIRSGYLCRNAFRQKRFKLFRDYARMYTLVPTGQLSQMYFAFWYGVLTQP